MVILGKLLFAIVFSTVGTALALLVLYCLGRLGWWFVRFLVWMVEGKPRWARFAVFCAIMSLWTFIDMMVHP